MLGWKRGTLSVVIYILLGAVDGDGRPLFVNNVSDGAIPMIVADMIRQVYGGTAKQCKFQCQNQHE